MYICYVCVCVCQWFSMIYDICIYTNCLLFGLFIYTYTYILFNFLLFCFRFVLFCLYNDREERAWAAESQKDESVTETDGTNTSRIMLQLSTIEIFMIFCLFLLNAFAG